MIQVKEQLEQCLDKFRAGTLTEGDLQQALENIDTVAKPQRLLYLQATNTSVTSSVEGMSIVDSERRAQRSRRTRRLALPDRA